MVSGFLCAYHGFMSAVIDGVLLKSYKLFEAGKAREGWFTNADLNIQFDACYVLLRHFHPVEDYDIYVAFDNSMTHKAKSPDGLDASKLNKSDGGSNIVIQKDGWYDSIIDGITIRTIQKMQTNSIPPVQPELLSILRARGKACMRLPNGEYSERELNKLCRKCKETGHKEDPLATCCLFNVLSHELDFLSQKSWLAETVEKYPGCHLLFYPKYHCGLNFIEMTWGWAKAYHRTTCTVVREVRNVT